MRLIWGGGNLNINGDVKLVSTGSQPAMDAENIYIGGRADIQTKSGITADNKVIIKDKAEVNVKATSSTFAINGDKGVDILDRAYVTAEANTAINSFHGSVNIEGYADLKALGANSAAISSGLNYIEDRHEVNISGEVKLVGYVGIGISKGDINVSGGKITSSDVQVGLYITQNGNIIISNGSEIDIASGIYSMRTNEGELVISDSMITAAGDIMAFGSVPELKYKNGFRVTAGENSGDARVVDKDDLANETFTRNKYVKIEPVKKTEDKTSSGHSYSLDYGIPKKVEDKTEKEVHDTINQNPFLDVNENDDYYNSVLDLYNKGIISGVSVNSFGPDKQISRGMIAAIIHRAEQSPEPGDIAKFLDVTSEKYYAKAVAWGAENNILSGFDSASFVPEGDITKEQLAVILYRYSAYRGMDTTVEHEKSRISDLDGVSDWAVDAVEWCLNNDVMKADGSGRFYPKNLAVRSEAAMGIAKVI